MGSADPRSARHARNRLAAAIATGALLGAAGLLLGQRRQRHVAPRHGKQLRCCGLHCATTSRIT